MQILTHFIDESIRFLHVNREHENIDITKGDRELLKLMGPFIKKKKKTEIWGQEYFFVD